MRGLAATVMLVAVAGCTTATGEGDVDLSTASTEPAQPRLATYTCDGGREMTVENRESSVLIASGDDSLELPAAPAGQTTRYAQAVYALLLEGPTAMWMAGNETPLTCVR